MYKEHDVLDSILIHVNALPASRGDVQIRVLLEDHLIEDARLTHLSAGLNFDPKEQVFRNFIRLVTTNARADMLRGRAVFTGGKTNETYEFSWVDPAGRLVAVNSVDIDANPVIAELDIEEGIDNAVAALGGDKARSSGDTAVFPLMPGIWRLVCTHRDNLLHSHAFLVLPKYPVNGNKHNANGDDGGEVNNASEAVDDSNTFQHNSDIQHFLAKFVSRFYNVSDYCFVDSSTDRPCNSLPWSYHLNTFNNV